jgi:hypothetical protein
MFTKSAFMITAILSAYMATASAADWAMGGHQASISEGRR